MGHRTSKFFPFLASFPVPKQLSMNRTFSLMVIRATGPSYHLPSFLDFLAFLTGTMGPSRAAAFAMTYASVASRDQSAACPFFFAGHWTQLKSFSLMCLKTCSFWDMPAAAVRCSLTPAALRAWLALMYSGSTRKIFLAVLLTMPLKRRSCEIVCALDIPGRKPIRGSSSTILPTPLLILCRYRDTSSHLSQNVLHFLNSILSITTTKSRSVGFFVSSTMHTPVHEVLTSKPKMIVMHRSWPPGAPSKTSTSTGQGVSAPSRSAP